MSVPSLRFLAAYAALEVGCPISRRLPEDVRQYLLERGACEHCLRRRRYVRHAVVSLSVEIRAGGCIRRRWNFCERPACLRRFRTWCDRIELGRMHFQGGSRYFRRLVRLGLCSRRAKHVEGTVNATLEFYTEEEEIELDFEIDWRGQRIIVEATGWFVMWSRDDTTVITDNAGDRLDDDASEDFYDFGSRRRDPDEKALAAVVAKLMGKPPS